MGIEHGSWKDELGRAKANLALSYEVARGQLLGALRTLGGQIEAEAKMVCGNASYVCGSMSRDEFIQARFRAHLHPVDFWGNSYQVNPSYFSIGLVTSGPDETIGSGDDMVFNFTFSELGSSLADQLSPPRGGADAISAPG